MNNIFFLAEKGILDGLWDGLGLFVEGLVRSIFYPICALVYKMIFYFYNIFEVLCNGKLLKSSELNMLFGRISLLLGVIMLFRVAFSFIQALIDPDAGLGDKEKGIPNVIKKVVIVIIMFGVSGYIFDLTADIQALIIKNNVISKFLLPQQVNDESFGGALAANLFTTFYNIDPRVDPSAFPFDGTITKTVPRPGVYEVQDVASSSNICAHEEYYINGLRKSIKENNDFNYLKNQCLGAKVFSDDEGEYEFIVEFNFLFCLVVGIAVLWFLINYCLSVGIRVIQLTVLQLLSPIAFIGYLEPKSDNMFNKWLKIYISTYIDVFIRMGIISFVCYICALIMEDWNKGTGTFWDSVGNPSGFVAKVIGIFMILALFQFAKKAPDLLKSIFPTGSSGLSFGTNKEAFKPLGYGTRAAGALAGATAFGAMSAASRYKDQRKLNEDKGRGYAAMAAIGGLGSGIVRGITTGGKKGNVFSNLRSGYSKQVETDDAYRDLVAKGGSRRGQFTASVTNAFGSDRGTTDSTIIQRSKRISESLKAINDKAEQSKGYQQFMDAKKAVDLNTNLKEDERNRQKQEIQKRADVWKEKYAKYSFDGSIQNMSDIDGIAVSGGDKVRSNEMRNEYIDLKSETDQIHPQIMVEENGKMVMKKVEMKEVDDVTFNDIDSLLKEAQRSESNVKGQPGYREGQANMPNRKNSN